MEGMNIVRYPVLKKGATIGVTAPSSGVNNELHELIKLACNRMDNKGYRVICGDTVRTQFKAKSSPAKQRADELNRMISDDSIDIIVPPWGGELLIEILEHVDFDAIPEKWALGYSC
jgi:muramoyltetrapeptide carboxypeptidase